MDDFTIRYRRRAMPEGWRVCEAWLLMDGTEGMPLSFQRSEDCPYYVTRGMIGVGSDVRWIVVYTPTGLPLRNARGRVRHYCSPGAAAFQAETEWLKRSPPPPPQRPPLNGQGRRPILALVT
jgi:hypothetical protein